MKRLNLSHLIITVVLLFAFGVDAHLSAAEMFLNPDTVLQTDAVGTDIFVNLEVDAATTSMRVFQIKLVYDESKLDTAWQITPLGGGAYDTTAAVVEGPLLASSGGTTVFNYRVTADTLLTIEGLILGQDKSVNGPGVLATMHFKLLDTGKVEISVSSFDLNDVNNDPIPGATARGAVIYHDYPPLEFNLLSPATDETVIRYIGEIVTFDWEPSSSVYPGEAVTYTLKFGRDPTFYPVGPTTTVTDIVDAFYEAPISALKEGMVFWKVTAIGTNFGFEKTGAPEPDSFFMQYELRPPADFDLLSPGAGFEFDLTDSNEFTFDWESADESGVPNEPDIRYVLEIGGTPIDSIDNSSEMTVLKTQLPVDSIETEWTVVARNSRGLSKQATSIRSLTFFEIIGCCGEFDPEGRAGNWSRDPGNVKDLEDILGMAAFAFLGGAINDCSWEGNVSGDSACVIDLQDVLALAAFAFLGGEDPAVCDDKWPCPQ